MAEPLQAPAHVSNVVARWQAALPSASRLMNEAGALWNTGQPFVTTLPCRTNASAPVPAGMQASRRLHRAIDQFLCSVERAERWRHKALHQVQEAGLTPRQLMQQALRLDGSPADGPDYRLLLPLVERSSLLAGMAELVAATETLDRELAALPDLPAVTWHWSTPWGDVMVDTTGRDNDYHLDNPLLVIDVGGNDRYDFAPRRDTHFISVVLDRGGNDQYVAETPGAGPSAAVMGYGVLWDTDGDDQHAGGLLAQGAALFGAALHWDGRGNDRYEATGFAQGFALGGVALLADLAGDDRFRAQTHAQAAGGPEGVGVLLDVAGDDHYLLGNAPLVLPSSQLPERNASMGQGAGRGLRPGTKNEPATAGGIGLLLDLAGNDHYTAQVFAQGAGYQEGLGMLFDGGGRDRFQAAWYAMGAAAHQGAGVLISEGVDDDAYDATHSTSIAAAHDLSVAYFLDQGGNDRYALGNLGLGAANDHGVAVFMDSAGDDDYHVSNARCQAFGGSWVDGAEEAVAGAGLFMDLDGQDRFPGTCVPRRSRPPRLLQ